MTINYSWKITSLVSEDGVVAAVHWRYEGTDSINIEGIAGYTPIVFDADASFIEFDNLHSNDVEKWLIETIGEEKISEYNAEIAKRLDEQKSLSLVSLPWASQNVEPQ